MPDTTIESLGLEITSDSSQAEKGLDSLSQSLEKLKSAVKDGLGLSGVISDLKNLNKETSSLGNSADRISKLADSLATIKNLGNIKISSSIGNQIRNIGGAISSIKGSDLSGIKSLGKALSPLSSITRPAGFTSLVSQLSKIPSISSQLRAMDWKDFAEQIDNLADSLEPLEIRLNSIGGVMGRLPTNMQRLVLATDSVTRSNGRAGTSYINLWAKLHMVKSLAQETSKVIGGLIEKSTDYTENLNLFNVSMGKSADSAKEYIAAVNELMGIDPSAWMRSQGVFKTITSGFGVEDSRAAIMSQQLTQLGYDLSSFFNVSYEDAKQKLQSGISGELEPLRRFGYDLSQAKLEAIAYSLGIKKAFTEMTQAEKAQLRYYAIMTQVTTAQGDMARTLEAPANQLRILNAQLEQAARAIGNNFIPMLQKVLPYAIAAAKVVRLIADITASLLGFKQTEADLSGITGGAETIGGIADNMEESAESANKLKKALLGIDELNILSFNKTSAAGAGASGILGDMSFDLPTYEFDKNVIGTKAEEIVGKMKEWLGITEEINSWGDLFDTRLGKILKTVGLVGGAFLAWKIASGVTGFITGLPAMLKQISGMITILSFAIEFAGAYDIGKNGLDWENGLTTALGAALGIGFAAVTFGSAGIVIGLAASVAITIAGFILGKQAHIRELYEQSDAYKELQRLTENQNAAIEVTQQLRIEIKAAYENYSSVTDDLNAKMEIIKRAFDLSDVANKTPEQLETLKRYIEEINSWKLEGIQLQFDDTTERIVQTRDSVLEVVEALKLQAKTAAIMSQLEKAYANVYEFDRNRAELEAVRDGITGEIAELEREGQELQGIYDDTLKAAMESFASKSIDVPIWSSDNPQWLMWRYLTEDGREYGEILEEITAMQKANSTALENANALLGENSGAISDNAKAMEENSELIDFLDGELLRLSGTASETEKAVSDTFSKTTEAVDSAGKRLERNPVANALKDIETQSRSTKTSVISDLSEIAAAFAGTPVLKGIGLNFNPQMVTLNAYAEGGTPATGELFLARERGPEFVGRIGNKTAVANNDDIVGSVSRGVYEASAEQTAVLKEQNKLLRMILEKDNSPAAAPYRDLISQIERRNRRDGKTVIPVGV